MLTIKKIKGGNGRHYERKDHYEKINKKETSPTSRINI